MKSVYGISVCNPVDIEREYLLKTVQYALEQKVKHVQFIGPIHNPVKGNVDGMTAFKKYSKFNCEKDMAYVKNAMVCVNEACDILCDAGVKTYVWHHELEVPAGFLKEYPELLNKYGDVEVTHPLIKDFLENKIRDFFCDYPKIDGIILTLHETRVPLLKLKNQKLSPIERVKYVTGILYDTCNELGKELIVRPFASTDEDYDMMMQAYESISNELSVMDKWTQFDWSLCLPHNKFYSKIKNNPLFVEADIFGEFFGMGKLPLMLKEHISNKFDYCNKFSPKGYVFRIDRGGFHDFGDVNEVNLYIADALIKGKDADIAVREFFERRFGEAGEAVRLLMEPTEELQKKIFYAASYYFTELSEFPMLNHSKNHFYFDIMKDEYTIASKEWYIPPQWNRGSIDEILSEKQTAITTAEQLFEKLITLKNKLSEEDYASLYKKFLNLKLIAKAWLELAKIFICYTKYFEKNDDSYKEKLLDAIYSLSKVNSEGVELLGNDFYCIKKDANDEADINTLLIPKFIEDVKKSFAIEEKRYRELAHKNITDFVVCGGAMEAHKLMKEVNFSDTIVTDNDICRIAGTLRGSNWSIVNAHGWFSYELKMQKDKENRIKIIMGTLGESIEAKVTVGDSDFELFAKDNQKREFTITYTPDKEYTRIRFDRISANTPCIYEIKVM